MWPANRFVSSLPLLTQTRQPVTAAELLRAPQGMARPVKNLSLTWSEIPQLPVLTPRHLLPAFDLLTQVPTIPLFSTENSSHGAEERDGERKEREAGNEGLRTLRTLRCLSIPSHPPLRVDVHTYSHPP